ncbi:MULTISPECIES: hypothetical protein [Hydrotalea]|uniref:hypothetical protein n=1 Tax=Hydrotalea TaxID=1004300 RepID=UPI001C45164F|nr:MULTISPECIES: hypothetical protein [Hydrotalea]
MEHQLFYEKNIAACNCIDCIFNCLQNKHKTPITSDDDTTKVDVDLNGRPFRCRR